MINQMITNNELKQGGKQQWQKKKIQNRTILYYYNIISVKKFLKNILKLL